MIQQRKPEEENKYRYAIKHLEFLGSITDDPAPVHRVIGYEDLGELSTEEVREHMIKLGSDNNEQLERRTEDEFYTLKFVVLYSDEITQFNKLN